jgi:pyridoxal 5'-phosphate synthase pdxS subunit
MNSEIRRAAAMGEEELFAYAKEIGAPYHLLKETARLKKLPVVNFAAGGVATPGKRTLLLFVLLFLMSTQRMRL